jgi:hypothetical protein
VSNSPDVYQPEERLIFHYYSGEYKGIVKADPMVLYKRFMSVRGDLQGDITVAFSPSKGAQAAHDGMIAKIRTLFDLVPYDQGGLTEGEAYELLQYFWSWCDRVKKNSKSSPTSPDATPDSSAPPTGEGPPTTSTSDFGSTSAENTTAAPGPS